MRLVKFIANAGVASRRKSDELIRSGLVTVNDKRIVDPAYAVSEQDLIRFDGRPISQPSVNNLTYVIFNKPVGVLSTMAPSRERGYSLIDFVQTEARLFPVGRLDQDSSGLLLMTNDGELTNLLTHPKHHVEKEYRVRLNRTLHPGEIDRLRRGIKIDDRIVEIDEFAAGHQGSLRIVIHEGRNRILRRLFGALGCNVIELKRTRIGSISIGRLPVGKWRKLTTNEIEKLWSFKSYAENL